MLRVFACLSGLLALISYVHGTHTAASGEIYTHKVVLSENAYDVFWKYDSEYITFEVEVATTGFVGFGLSPNGGMAGADIVIGGVRDDGSSYFTDRYAAANGEPSVDAEQNYELLHYSQSSTKTTLRFKRRLDTCDVNDMLINGDTFRVIWAHGPTDTITYHGPSSANRGSKSVLLLGKTPIRPTMPSDATTHDFLVENVTVPTSLTTYWCKGFDVPALSQKHHVLKYEPVITPGNEALVHHIIIYACYGDVNTTGVHGTSVEECGLMPNDLAGFCRTTLFAWAIGGEDFYFPEHVGFPLGDSRQPTFFMMELHYDNPTQAQGLIDSSGLRLTLSPTLRQHDAGLLSVGHGVYRTQVIPPNAESFTSYGYCKSECTKEGLAGEPNGIKLFAGVLHAHLLGRKLRLRHIRNGVEQEPVFEDSNYDFNYQEMQLRTTEKIFLPGDEMQLDCEQSSVGKNTVTYGGLGTTEEMCLTFVLYYPRANLSDCMSVPGDISGFFSAKGIPIEYRWPAGWTVTGGTYAGKTAEEALNAMSWNASDIALMETTSKDAAQYLVCTSSGRVLEAVKKPIGFYHGINITTPLQAAARNCPLPTAQTTTEGVSFGTSHHVTCVPLIIIASIFVLLSKGVTV